MDRVCAGDEDRCNVATWPLRKTVSSGSLMKSSPRDKMNVLIEYVVGVRVGSMRNVERRNRGIEEDMKEGIVEFRRVIGSNEAETLIDGNERRAGTKARGVALRGVIIRLEFHVSTWVQHRSHSW